MAHILVAGKLHAAGVGLLKATTGHSFKLIEEVSLQSYAPEMPEADALLLRTQPLTAELVAASPRLAIVSRHGVGYDAVDVQALNARAIPLTIVGDVNSRAVAEHTLMLMLSTARCVVAHDKAARNGQWNVRNRFETIELDGKILLLLGFGRIGRRVAQLAQAFGMTVHAFDPFVSPEAMSAIGVTYEPTIAGALPRADYVSLHLPMATGGPVIGATELAQMKPSAILVNAARGGLIDETALDHALRTGKLFAAGLDVLAAEPPAPDHPLLTNERVTISPHSAGLTDECAARMAMASVQNILDFFAGKLNPALVVNADAINLKR
jgi:D-3-phosphoglycerate dehydrogenase / 2-oxoglutarate reductase